MTLPKELTTVTLLSKTLAMILFVTLPIIAFFYGMRYEQMQLASLEILRICPTVMPKITPGLPGSQVPTVIPSISASLSPTSTVPGSGSPKADFYKLPIKEKYCLGGPQKVGITLNDGTFVLQNQDGTYTRYSPNGNMCL